MALKHLFRVREGEVLFSRISKPGMFGLGMTPKETFPAHSAQLTFLIIILATRNVVIAATDMFGKSSIMGE